MARRRPMGELSEYATTVVRLFPGYAESVIWFMSPVSYGETQLDAQLVADLEAWERSSYAGLTPELDWRSRTLRAEFSTEGARLARRLAGEIGDQFQVEYRWRNGSRRRVRGGGPARNPDAAAAFGRLAEAAYVEWEKLRRIVDQADRDGPELQWRADRPSSD